jgi:hypothetical protein
MQTSAQKFFRHRFPYKASGFQRPTQLPRDEAQRRQWQTTNRSWWESTPMRHDWREPLTSPVGTRDYFEELDSRFLTSVYKYMP